VTDVDAQANHEATKVIPLSGILDAQAGRSLRDVVNEALEAGHRTILVDFQAGTYIDSNGFGSLVACLKKTREAGGKLSLRGLNNQVRLVMEMTGTDRIFDVFKDEDSASAAKP
jgi:anti-anti-sigma factor